MKFGRNLPRNQVPEWASFYINYKGLKKLIKAAEETAKRGEKVDLAEFFFALDRNLEDVDSFYNKKYSETHRRLRAVRDRYGSSPDVSNLDQDEVEELMGALLELRSQLRNLQWFGEINRRGFTKITKKLDKKVPDICTQHRYMATKVDPKPFARDTAIVRLLSEVNKWLQVLGDSQQIDDDKSDRSARSTRSIARASAKAMLNLPQTVLEQLEHVVRKDDVKTLGELLAAHLKVEDAASQGLLLNLLQRSISARSKASIEYLLKHVKSLEEADDINTRNCIHRLVIHMGRSKSGPSADQEPSSYPFQPPGAHYGDSFLTPAASPMAAPRLTKIQESNTLGGVEEPLKILSFILDRLFDGQRDALHARDSFGRFPLHYAAQFGFVEVCQLLMAKMQDWGQFKVENGIDAPEWQDKDGFAPLHLAVIGGHPVTTQTLLRAEDWQGFSDNKLETRKCISKSGAVLSIATKHNYFKIVKMLVEAGVDINWQNETGETALHVAARFGFDECAKVLIEGSDSQRPDLEMVEQAFGWTPLHIAAVDGHMSVARLLVEEGADVDKPDSGGWTAKEHAALRGHLRIADFLLENSRTESLSSTDSDDGASTAGTSPPGSSSLGDRRSLASSKVAEPRPVRTYGHRYLRDETLVLVSLGSMDMRKNLEAVKLDKVPLAQAHHTQLDTALSIVVSASGANGDPTVIDLPVHDNISTEPMLFTTQDVASVKLLFDIVPTYSGNDKNKIGRAMAMLSHVRPSLGSKRANLQGDVCVPIIAPNLEFIGTVNFNFLVITPFVHPKMEVTEEQTYWRRMTSSTMVIGHRGLGKNSASNRSLQLGENTVPSFIAAANLGANYVEFDVQLTKDHIPVIYHDFLVSETGFDAPVHTLTLEQFLHINPDTNRRNKDAPADTLALPDRTTGGPSRGVSPASRRGRSMSMKVTNSERSDKIASDALDERMKHTRDFKAKGFKANSRGNFIQAPFATLEDLFRQVPTDVGFNIEMKYPMLQESEEHEMDTYAVEMNSFCDTVLEKVYDLAALNGGSRNVIFSSFNPDICLCLSFKQPNYPIMFLTDAGSAPVGDVRASSLQEAVRFAGRWNLLGIVSMSEPLVNSPRLIRIVKGSGLVCASYGVQNNVPELVQRQVKEDIDAVIVDSVFAIRRGLRGEGEQHPPKSEAAQTISEKADVVDSPAA